MSSTLASTSTVLSSKEQELEEMFAQLSSSRTKLAEMEAFVKSLKEAKAAMLLREENHLTRFNQEHESTQVLEGQLRKAHEDLEGERRVHEKT